MHMIFVDESGDPGYPTDGDWSKFGGSDFFTRVGVIIHGWKWKAWNERLLDFKKKNGLLWNDEIKASHIKRGKGCFVGWNEPKRSHFLDDLLSLIGLNEDITLIWISIDKKRIDTKRSGRLVKPEIRSMELLLEGKSRKGKRQNSEKFIQDFGGCMDERRGMASKCGRHERRRKRKAAKETFVSPVAHSRLSWSHSLYTIFVWSKSRRFFVRIETLI